MTDMKKTTIYLPVEVLLEVKAISKQDHRSEAGIIREALGEYLAKRQQPKPSVFGMGANGRIRASESENWLEENWKSG